MERLSGQPLHQQLSHILFERITAGEYPPGGLLPSEADLCRTYGISRSTVRQALGSLVASGLIRRTRGRGTFVATVPRPRQTTAARHNTIGLVISRLGGTFTGIVLEGIHRVLTERNHALTIESAGVGDEEGAIRQLTRHGVAGVLLAPSALQPTRSAIFREVLDSGMPLVFFDRYCRDVPAPWVASDNFGGGRDLGRHLVRLGHHRLGYILPREHPTTSTEDRLRGVRTALAEARLDPDSLQIVRVGGQPFDPMGPAVRAAADALLNLATDERPTAILCGNDDIALDTLAALRQHGLAIPEDIAVTGFDDLPVAELVHPPLTTVHQDAAEMGARAAALLLETIRRGTLTPRRIILPVALRIRRSTVGGAPDGYGPSLDN